MPNFKYPWFQYASTQVQGLKEDMAQLEKIQVTILVNFFVRNLYIFTIS
jgi:hypothetical protein